MVNQLVTAALLGVAALAAAPGQADEPRSGAKIRVLIIDGQNNHDWRSTTPFMKKQLEACGRFTVDVATTPTPPGDPPRLQRGQGNPDPIGPFLKQLERYREAALAYHAGMEKFHPDLTKYDVVLSNYNGDFWNAGFDKDLEEAVQSGKVGLVIVHAANNSFGNWLEYNRMIGMGWRGSSFGDRLTLDTQGQPVRVPKGKGPGAGHGAGHAFRVVVRDDSHPITRGMPKEWLHAADELYHGMRGPVENVTLLATSFSDKKLGGTGEHEPMIWTVAYGKGRVFHTPMGHDLNGMRCVGFVTTLRRGTEWAATGTVTLPIPEHFPSPVKTSSVSAK
jgi:type 1 glutamine amidotransferase